MKSAVWQNLDIAARKLTPFLITLVLVVVSLIPLRMPGYSMISPALALMAVYYWALHRPELLPGLAVFVIGLLQDVLSGTPLGMSGFTFLAVYGVAVSQRRFFHGKSFLVVWWGFMLVAVGVALLQWGIMSLLMGVVIAIEPAAFEALLTISLYPLLSWIFVQAHRTLPRYG